METARFGLYWVESGRQISDKGDMSSYWRKISSEGDFMGTPPSYTLIKDLMLSLCYRLIACSIVGSSQAPKKVTMTDLFYLRGMDVGSVNIPYLLARYLRLFTSGRKHGAMISGGQFVDRLAEHFGLLTEERLQGLAVIVRDLPVIDMAELPDAAAGALEIAEGSPDVVKGDQRLARVEEEAAGGISQLLDSAGATYVWYSETHVPYPRCRVRHKTGKASTLAAPLDEDQPDP
ncbi:hypothetical protein Tco_1306525 [Tanacetum coccineum]